MGPFGLRYWCTAILGFALSLVFASSAPSDWARIVLLVAGPISTLYLAALVQGFEWQAPGATRQRPRLGAVRQVLSDDALADKCVWCKQLTNDQVLLEAKKCNDPTYASILLAHPVWRIAGADDAFLHIVSLASEEAKRKFLINGLTALSMADALVLQELGLARIHCVISTDHIIGRLLVRFAGENQITVLDTSIQCGTTIRNVLVSRQDAEERLEVVFENERIFLSKLRLDAHQVLCVRSFGGRVSVSMNAESH